MRITRRKLLIGAGIATAGITAELFLRKRSLVQPEADLLGEAMKTMAYDIEGNDKPLTDTVARARFAKGKFDIGISLKAMYQNIVGELIAANPALVMAVYTNGTHSKKAPPYFPLDWYIYDINGVPVRSKAFPDNHLMNPRSSWVGFKMDEAKALLDSDYNAIYVDELGVGPVYLEGVTSAPVISGSRTPYTWDEWMKDCIYLAKSYQTVTAKPVYANGLGNGARFFEYPVGDVKTSNGGNTRPLLDVCDRTLGESFLRGATQPPSYYPTVKNWNRDVDMVAAAGAKSMFCCKVWSSTDAAVVARIHRWSLGSFLLGANPDTAWYFTGKNAKELTPSVTPWSATWDRAKQLGNPVSPRDNTHRDFVNGYVDVNNTTHDAQIVVKS